MTKIEPANLLLKDKNGNTGLVKSLTNKDITTLKNVVTNVNYIKDFVNANGGSLPVQGDLRLTATDAAGKNGKILLGTSSGTLQWNGKNIVRSVNGTNADVNGNVAITSVANATNADNATNLGGYSASDYVRSVNGVNADAEGNVSDIVESGAGYIRYANGVQICWGKLQKYTLLWTDHQGNYNLPKPFKDTRYTVQTTAQGSGDDFVHVEVDLIDKSYFHCSFIPLSTYGDGTIKVTWGEYSIPYNSLYLAIGYWK